MPHKRRDLHRCRGSCAHRQVHIYKAFQACGRWTAAIRQRKDYYDDWTEIYSTGCGYYQSGWWQRCEGTPCGLCGLYSGGCCRLSRGGRRAYGQNTMVRRGYTFWGGCSCRYKKGNRGAFDSGCACNHRWQHRRYKKTELWGGRKRNRHAAWVFRKAICNCGKYYKAFCGRNETFMRVT